MLLNDMDGNATRKIGRGDRSAHMVRITSIPFDAHAHNKLQRMSLQIGFRLDFGIARRVPASAENDLLIGRGNADLRDEIAACLRPGEPMNILKEVMRGLKIIPLAQKI